MLRVALLGEETCWVEAVQRPCRGRCVYFGESGAAPDEVREALRAK